MLIYPPRRIWEWYEAPHPSRHHEAPETRPRAPCACHRNARRGPPLRRTGAAALCRRERPHQRQARADPRPHGTLPWRRRGERRDDPTGGASRI